MCGTCVLNKLKLCLGYKIWLNFQDPYVLHKLKFKCVQNIYANWKVDDNTGIPSICAFL
jgi:hypothetical protein